MEEYSTYGWIKLHRKILDSPIWNDGERKCKTAAWIELLLLANHEDREMLFKGSDGVLVVKRGQLHTSIAHLAERWKWDKKTVRRYLDVLEKAGMISQKRTTHGTTITIENYSKYQDTGTTVGTAVGTTVGTTVGTQTRSKEYKEVKECKEDEERAPASLSSPDLKKIIRVYENCGKTVNRNTVEDLNDLRKEFGIDWTVKAIRRANQRGREKVNIGYIRAILEDWREKGGIDDGRTREAARDDYEPSEWEKAHTV